VGGGGGVRGGAFFLILGKVWPLLFFVGLCWGEGGVMGVPGWFGWRRSQRPVGAGGASIGVV